MAVPYPDREELEFMVGTARLEGLILDPVYTAKALYGLVQEVPKRPRAFDRRVVFIHTGGIFHLFSPVPGLAEALGESP